MTIRLFTIHLRSTYTSNWYRNELKKKTKERIGASIQPNVPTYVEALHGKLLTSSFNERV